MENGNDNKLDIVNRIQKKAYELRHRRKEGFEDSSLESRCIVHEIKFLFEMLDSGLQGEILNKPWLDE